MKIEHDDKVTPFLWYEKGAEEAAKLYVSLFPDSKIEEATPMMVTFTLAGRRFMALNGGPHYKATPAYSMFVRCSDQREVDELWEKLMAGGGKEDRCGWLRDRFGLSWQVCPVRLLELLSHRDRDVATRARDAMMEMKKIDIKRLEQAAGEARRSS
jgi:predicted 3-demethylubiquinone-9 3-methyltransferase (glyoxalase superfamily)